jgi:hypothetical protein
MGSPIIPNACRITATQRPKQMALPQTIRQNPIGFSSIVQVQPRLLAVTELRFRWIPQIAHRPRIANMMAW